ncbi:MAG TPA: hypothetical protein VK843_17125 [Planctomycetota bacterium]|nr:hypothetical protein [Planctomycetota bacterium]
MLSYPPTIDVTESPQLREAVRGSVVVADGHRKLRIASLPSGALLEIKTSGDAIAASGLDDQGRVAYLRKSKHTPIFMDDDNGYTLVVKSITTGKERELGEVRGMPRGDYCVVSIAGGLVLFQCINPPRIFDLQSRKELDLSWWQDQDMARELSADGREVTVWRMSTQPDGTSREVSIAIDLATHERRVLPERVPAGVDLGWKWRVIGGNRNETPMLDCLPGCVGPPRFLDDRLALYVGLASTSSKPDIWFSMAWPSFERSIRLGDFRSVQTFTLVPHFRLGTWVFSPHAPNDPSPSPAGKAGR